MKKLKEKELKKLFEEKILPMTCFDSLEEPQKDKTPLQSNAVRVIIAVELKGVWRGLKFMNDMQEGK